jgi:hypothetical protein
MKGGGSVSQEQTRELDEITLTTRRATVARAGVLAAASALLASRLEIFSAEAKKKKRRKKKRKKAPPAQVVARLQAASMTGAKEVPPEDGDAGASGSATFDIKSNGEICCDFDVMNLEAESVIILTHIRQGALGEEPPNNIVVDFAGKTVNCVKPGQAILDEILANPAGFYANLHTDKHPNGAVRDQLAAVV